MQYLTTKLTRQLSAQEQKDIEDGCRLVAMLGGDQAAIDGLIEVSLLALGFEEGNRNN
jgi:hypothetical protein